MNSSLQSRTLLLEPNKPVKIGRAIARTKVSDNNAIFDCKVLSRNHAELWYEDGKFYLKVSGRVFHGPQPVDLGGGLRKCWPQLTIDLIRAIFYI